MDLCPRGDLNPETRAFSPILRLSTQAGEKSPVRVCHAAMLAGASRIASSRADRLGPQSRKGPLPAERQGGSADCRGDALAWADARPDPLRALSARTGDRDPAPGAVLPVPWGAVVPPPLTRCSAARGRGEAVSLPGAGSVPGRGLGFSSLDRTRSPW
jgi:hypothetical protein